MSDRLRAGVVLVIGALTLAAVVFAPATYHGAIGLFAFVTAWVIEPLVGRRMGRPQGWFLTSLVLLTIGAWLGPRPERLGPAAISTNGVLAATTMLARAVGLVMTGAAFGVLVPAARLLARLHRTPLRRFAEVLVIALELAPSLLTALDEARAEIRLRYPRASLAPRRAFEALVFAIVHASTLAASVATRLSQSTTKES